MIHKESEFIVEAGLFDSLGFGADCFLFTTRASLPSQLARYRWYASPVNPWIINDGNNQESRGITRSA